MDLVFLHGPAAAGKLTVARALAERLGLRVFHNHLVVDALTAVFPFGSEEFVELRERWWLEALGRAARAGVPTVFTFTPEPTVAPGLWRRVSEVVTDAGGRVHLVELRVGEAEQQRRVALPDRRAFGKLADVDVLLSLRAVTTAAERPPADLVVDTERVAPGDAAALVARTFGLTPAPRHTPYPNPRD